RRLHHGRQIIAANAYNYRRPPADQIRCQCRQPVELIFRPTVFDRDILALAKAGLFQTFAKCAQAVRESIRRYRGEEADNRQRLLLRARGERPCRRAAECDQQFPPSDGDCHAPLPCEVRKGTIARHEGAVFTLKEGWTAALAAQPKHERLSPVSPLASSVQGMTE